MVLEYYRPADIGEALACLRKSPRTTRILAGGTDLIIRMRERTVAPEYIVDIGGIPDLREIKIDGGTLVIGGAATFAAIEDHPGVERHVPALARAAGSVGSPQIRNTGTIGGNIANAAPAADMIPPLLALGARVELKSAGGSRVLGLEEILAGINKTKIMADEILTGVNIPLPGPGTYGAFVKLGRRKSLSIARLNLGLTLSLVGNRVSRCALALGSVGETAYRVPQVERLLEGSDLDQGLMAAACSLVSETVAHRLGSRPTAPYKRAIAAAALKMAFTDIIHQTGGRRA